VGRSGKTRCGYFQSQALLAFATDFANLISSTSYQERLVTSTTDPSSSAYPKLDAKRARH
jgi:hypothetical protein